jgi:tRNA-dihydrouridine synthase
MLHTENLLTRETFRKNHLDLWEYSGKPTKWTREQVEFLDGSSAHCDDNQVLHDTQGWTTGPVIVQLAGHDPSRVVQAANLVLEHTEGRVHGFDLNLGE